LTERAEEERSLLLLLLLEERPGDRAPCFLFFVDAGVAIGAILLLEFELELELELLLTLAGGSHRGFRQTRHARAKASFKKVQLSQDHSAGDSGATNDSDATSAAGEWSQEDDLRPARTCDLISSLMARRTLRSIRR
jgi:hypothetical protein